MFLLRPSTVHVLHIWIIQDHFGDFAEPFIQGQASKSEKQQMEPAVEYMNELWISMNFHHKKQTKLDCYWASDEILQWSWVIITWKTLITAH